LSVSWYLHDSAVCFYKIENLFYKLCNKKWLIKSEPNVWSIDQQQKAGAKGTAWDGVRNYQAANNLKQMSKGDLCFLSFKYWKGNCWNCRGG